MEGALLEGFSFSLKDKASSMTPSLFDFGLDLLSFLGNSALLVSSCFLVLAGEVILACPIEVIGEGLGTSTGHSFLVVVFTFAPELASEGL